MNTRGRSEETCITFASGNLGNPFRLRIPEEMTPKQGCLWPDIRIFVGVRQKHLQNEVKIFGILWELIQGVYLNSGGGWSS